MKYGIKVPFELFEQRQTVHTQRLLEKFENLDALLAFYAKRVEVAELSMVSCTADADVLLDAALKCREYGLSVTIHGVLAGVRSAEEFFVPYEKLLKETTEEINITIHPLETAEQTVKILTEICEMIDRMHYPVQITLENQRNRSPETAYANCRGVTEIVKQIQHPKLFLCFDFGHQLSNIRKEIEPTDLVDAEFLSRVRHTHIHSMFEGKTHYPLTCGETLLEENISGLLQHGFDGVLLLELGADRYGMQFDVVESADRSISILKMAVAQLEQKQKAVLRYCDYEPILKNISEKIRENWDGIGVLGPAMYLVKMGNTKLLIDPAFWEMPFDHQVREGVIGLMSLCDAVIVTHAHADHFDSGLLEMLPKEQLRLIPDFMPQQSGNVVRTTDGFEIKVGDVELCFFESAHSVKGNFVPEYGFAIRYRGKHYVFPVDVRDYEKAHKTFPDTSILMAHLWLGKGNALHVYDSCYPERFARFVNSFDAERVYLSHMFDFRRMITDMWTTIHYNLVKDKIKNSQVLSGGDWIDLEG